MNKENEEIEWYISEENQTVFSGKGFNEESQKFIKEGICEKCFTPKEIRKAEKRCPICEPAKRYQERKMERMIELEKEFEYGRCNECNRSKMIHKWSKNCMKCYGDKRKYKKGKYNGMYKK